MKTSQWRRAVENRYIFSAHLKVFYDRSGDRCAGGRRFHVVGWFLTALSAHNSSIVPCKN